jgi:hypothetical protein
MGLAVPIPSVSRISGNPESHIPTIRTLPTSSQDHELQGDGHCRRPLLKAFYKNNELAILTELFVSIILKN